MVTIYVVRHGQNLDNAHGILNGRRDEPLTELGETQAKTLAKEIQEKGLRFDAVYSSPLSRALRTAEIISRQAQQPAPIVIDKLIERDFGVMTGKPISEIEAHCAPRIIKTDTVTYFLDPEGAETFPDLLARATDCLNLITQTHAAGSVLLVCHGDVGKMLYAAFYELPWETILTDFHFGNSEMLYLAPGSAPEERRMFVTEQFNH